MKSSLTDLKEVFESKETKEWRWSQLKEIAGINPRRPRDLKRPDEAPTTFVPMPSVDGNSGNISDPLEKPFGEIKKGYTYFEKNDVLFAKITPCMQNGKHVIARNLIDGIGFGTTEFHVIRPGDEVIPEWIHLYIRQPSILNEAATHFTGSVGQQRVPPYFLEDLAIPLPPLSEQKRIAAILNDHMADIARARAAAEAQLEAAEALSAAYLREIFESKEAQKWSWPQLKEIAGINPRRPRDLRRTDETPTTFVPMPSVDGTSGTISNPLEKPFGEVRKGYTYFEKNDVLFAKITPCMQNKKHVIARKLIDGIGFGTTEFHVIRPGDEVIPEWIHLYIRQPSILNAAATHFTGSVGQQRVPSYFLETLAIPLPSLSEQKRIAAILNDRMAGIARACNAVREKLEAINHLPSAILRKAFNGEL